MSEENEELREATPEELEREQLKVLKLRATVMGITFSNNIGLEALKLKIDEKMNSSEPEKEEEPEEQVNPLEEFQPKKKKQNLRQILLDRELRLIRLRITNLDPKKADLKGEFVTFSNNIIGTVKKFVPYGEATDNGYHVPYCIYKILKRRTFQQIHTTKSKSKRDEVHIQQRDVREFALEILEPLTKEEIRQIAAQQAASGGLGD